MPQPTQPFGKHNPCLRCLKIYRNDYDGYCMDCADELGTSELHDEGQKKNPLAKILKENLKKYPTVNDLPGDGTITRQELEKFKKAGGKISIVDDLAE